MNFATLEFLLFFLFVYSVYWIIPFSRWRIYFLTATSFYFYGSWDWRFLSLFSIVIFVSWLSSYVVHKHEKFRKLALWAAVFIDLGILVLFKYLNFFTDTLYIFLQKMNIPHSERFFQIILPVGLSFYVFQALSFVIDNYTKKIDRYYTLIDVAFYISFFPQLVAGPIVRAAEFLEQIPQNKIFKNIDFETNFWKICQGLIYKKVFADWLGQFVDAVYTTPSNFSAYDIKVATFCFYQQIYFDFAGYSLVAIGMSGLFGYYLPDNFNFPYLATSIVDFWRRWHISLSSFLKDYLYVPLGGNRNGTLKRYQNLMTTMLLGGLWHGANWTFVLWGVLHGFALVLNHGFTMFQTKISESYHLLFKKLFLIPNWFLTQLFVMVCWIPFRAKDFTTAKILLNGFLSIDFGKLTITTSLYVLILPILLDSLIISNMFSKYFDRKFIFPAPLRFASIGFVLALIIALLYEDTVPFIYFQF